MGRRRTAPHALGARDLALLLRVATAAWLGLVADAQFCSSHSQCPPTLYCDAGGMCYTCSYITPVHCDALGGDCCAADFLAQCTLNPAQCAVTPSPEPGGGGDGEGERGNGWTIVIVLFCCPAACALPPCATLALPSTNHGDKM